MAAEEVETLVVGAGQAGLAASEQLSRRGLPHLVLERHRIAERWRSERWDSLVANGPAWHDRFPTQTFEGTDPDAFPTRDAVVAYFEACARRIAAPVRCGVAVTRAEPDGRGGFRVQTSAGTYRARNLICATGPFQRPLVPPLVPPLVSGGGGLVQLHSSAYRNPGQLPPGAVLVVGAGSSGVQIADELNRAGRRVVLSVGPHGRPPRRYRGRDFVWWLGRLGKWDLPAPAPGTEHVTIAVSGAHGGATVDFRRLAWQGITLAGRAQGFDGGAMHFAPDLAATVARGDADHLALLDEADAWAEAHAAAEGLDLPADPAARVFPPDPPGLADPPARLDLAAEGIAAIVWATGYGFDFGWLAAGRFDARGRPEHHRGIAPVPGLYFLGLPWLTCRGSSFIWGVWRDAGLIADHIAARAARAARAAGAARAAP